jgi:hypothetical protein
MLHCLSTEGFPRAHDLLHKGFGIQTGRLVWGPRDDTSGMTRTMGEGTQTPNVWTRWILDVDRQGSMMILELWINLLSEMLPLKCT